VQVKVPLRLVKEAFLIPDEIIKQKCARSPVTVASVAVVVYADGVRQPDNMAGRRGWGGTDTSD